MIQILASMAAIAALLFTMSARAAPPSAEDALKDRIMGDPNAPVEIVEYSSLTCPHCRNFHLNVLPEIKKKYIDTGKVKMEITALRAALERLGTAVLRHEAGRENE